MKKLIQTIQQLGSEDFSKFKKNLENSKSEKFLHLTVSYREGQISDAELLIQLNCNDNALYVLKSRLYDKIQKFLTEQNNTEEVQTDYCKYLYDYPRETAIAILHQFEQQNIDSDRTTELIRIYSVLKKAYAYSEKHYHYSQLYNKQVAYLLAQEKAEDLLVNFNKTLANYYFSNSDLDLEKINLLKKEIKNIHALNHSKRIELILNVIIIQIGLFTKLDISMEEPIEDLLLANEKTIQTYLADVKIEKFRIVNHFLYSEYYIMINQNKKANLHTKEIIDAQTNWLHTNSLCISFKFMLSRLASQLDEGLKTDLANEFESMNYDKNDFYTSVVMDFCKGLSLYYCGKLKESISSLNKLLNEVSLVNFTFIEIEVKLALGYIYYKHKDLEQADTVLKSLNRKLTNEKNSIGFNNAKMLIKYLILRLNNTDNYTSKEQNVIEQFEFYNSKERALFLCLKNELRNEFVLN